MTEVLPEPEPRPGSRPLLGELLVNAGLVTPEVMAKALAEQQRTGLPIGRILVEGGYIPGHRLAMALADQHGGPVRTEYGFATGHAQPIAPSPLQQVASELPSLRVVTPPAESAAVEPMPAVPAPEPVPEPVPDPDPDPVPEPEPEPEPEPAALDEERERLVAELAQAETSLKDLMRLLEQEQEARTAADETATEARRQLETVAQMLAQEKAAREQAEAAAAELRQSGAAVEEAARRLEQEQDARVQAEAAVADARERLEAVTAEVAALRNAGSTLDEVAAQLRKEQEMRAQAETALADASVRIAELETAVQAPAPDPRGYPIDRHHLFVPGADKYRLLERSGPPPAPAALVEVDGAAYTVLRLGPSPTPERVACAFLEPAHREI
jgi:hypothetical protein